MTVILRQATGLRIGGGCPMARRNCRIHDLEAKLLVSAVISLCRTYPIFQRAWGSRCIADAFFRVVGMELPGMVASVATLKRRPPNAAGRVLRSIIVERHGAPVDATARLIRQRQATPGGDGVHAGVHAWSAVDLP